jgi:hypothetical protein
MRILLLSLAMVFGIRLNAQAALLETGYRQMYNLQFDEAHGTFHDWERLRPDDPMGPVSDAAAYLFTEFDRLHILQSEFFLDDQNFETRRKLSPDPVLKRKFLDALARSDVLAKRVLERAPEDANALFATVLRLGLRADYLALVEKRYLASLSDVKTSRLLAEKLLANDPDNGDAYLAIGVENYLLSLKPAPLRWLLRIGGAQTDKERGIEKLSITAEKGHYLLPYARVLLAVAALRDHNWSRARELLDWLAREFPHNRLYPEELARLQ